MPYAKTDVGFIREHFATVPEKNRAAAIALYSNLVLISAELLLDGALPRTVVEAGGAQIGISRGRYARREIASVATSLTECGLVEIANDGTWHLTYWRDHHASREYVDSRRKADADRKREAREQLTIPSATPVVHKGRPTGVRSGQSSDSRAHARTRAAADSKKEDLAAAVSPNHDTEPGPGPNPAAAADIHEELEQLLDDLAIPASLRQRAANEPERALAVARYTIANEGGGAYFRTVFESGDHPTSGQPRAQAKPAALNGSGHGPAHIAALIDNGVIGQMFELRDELERSHMSDVDRDALLAKMRALFTSREGYRLPGEALEAELGEMGAAGDELVELLDLAADLRRVEA